MPFIKSSVTILASAARTATFNGVDQTALGHKGVVLSLDITAASGTAPTLDVSLQIKDALGLLYVAMPSASFAQKTGVSTDTLTIYPGVAASANRQVSALMPITWRLVYTIGGTTPSFTFSVSGDYAE